MKESFAIYQKGKIDDEKFEIIKDEKGETMSTHGDIWVELMSDVGGERRTMLHAMHDGYMSDMMNTVLTLPLHWLGETESRNLADVLTGRWTGGDTWRVNMVMERILDENRHGTGLTGVTKALIKGLEGMDSTLSLGFGPETVASMIIGSSPTQYIANVEKGYWGTETPDVMVRVSDDRLPLITAQVSVEVEADAKSIRDNVNELNEIFEPITPWVLNEKGRELSVSYSPDLVMALAILWAGLSCKEPFFELNGDKKKKHGKETIEEEQDRMWLAKRLLSMESEGPSGIRTMFGDKGKGRTTWGGFMSVPPIEIRKKLAESMTVNLLAAEWESMHPAAERTLFEIATPEMTEWLEDSVKKEPKLSRALSIAQNTLMKSETESVERKVRKKI